MGPPVSAAEPCAMTSNGHTEPTTDRRSRIHLSCGSKETPSNIVTNDVAGAQGIRNFFFTAAIQEMICDEFESAREN